MAARSSWTDVTLMLMSAADELNPASCPMLHGEKYDPVPGLQAIEIMDPRLDPGAIQSKLPSVQERFEDGSVPTSTTTTTTSSTSLPPSPPPSSPPLTPERTVEILDSFLIACVSYIYGNSIPQTLLRSLYLHPAGLASLAALVSSSSSSSSSSAPLYTHALEPPPDFPCSIPPQHRAVFPTAAVAAGHIISTPTAVHHQPVPAKLPAHKPGSASHTLTLAIFASALATLKIAGLTFEFILAGDNFRDEDFVAALYGADLAWAVQLEKVMQVLREAEYAIVRAEGSGISASDQASASQLAAVAEREKVLKNVPESVDSTMIFGSSSSSSSSSSLTSASGTTGNGKGGKNNKKNKNKNKKKAASGAGPEKKKQEEDGEEDEEEEDITTTTTTTSTTITTDAETATTTSNSTSSSSLLVGLYSLAPINATTPASEISYIDDTATPPPPPTTVFVIPRGTTVESLGDPATSANLLLRLRFLRNYLSFLHASSVQKAQKAAAPLFCGRIFNLQDTHTSLVAAWDAIHAMGKRNSAATAAASGDPKSTSSSPSPPGVFPEYERLYLQAQRPRFVPLPSLPDAISQWEKHISLVAFVTQLPALATHNPHRPLAAFTSGKREYHLQTSPVSIHALTPIARALATCESIPLPVIPESGLRDGPVQWGQDVDEEVVDNHSNNSVGGTGAATAGSRSHVSMHALWKFLTFFLQRDADIVARSFLGMVLITTPTSTQIQEASASDAASSSTSSSSTSTNIAKSDDTIPVAATEQEFSQITEDYRRMREDDSWKKAHVRSPVIFGTHTLVEILYSSQRDVGVSAEFLYTHEGRRFCDMMDAIMQATLCLFALSPVRFRRDARSALHEWSLATQEASFYDATWLDFLHKRYGVLRHAAESGAEEKNSAAAAIPLDGINFTAAVPGDRRLILTLLRLADFHRSMSVWTEMFAISLVQLYTRIGMQIGLYHPDEALTVAWHEDIVTKHLQKQQVYTELGRANAWFFPELGQVTEESKALYKAGKGPILSRIPPSPSALPSSQEEEDEMEEKEVDPSKAPSNKEKKKATITKPTTPAQRAVAAADEECEVSFKEKLTFAISLRNLFREAQLYQAQAAYNAVLLRGFVSAKLAGLWQGLGVEACAHARGVQETGLLNLAAQLHGKWSPQEGTNCFRHPALTYRKRWAVFDSFPQLAPNLSFAKYVGSFAAPCTVETMMTLAEDAKKHADLCLIAAGRINRMSTAALVASPAALGELAEVGSPIAKHATTEAAAAAGAGGNGGRSSASVDVDGEGPLPRSPVAPSSLDILLSFEDHSLAQSFESNVIHLITTILSMVNSPYCSAMIAYRYAVNAAEADAWEAEVAASDAAMGVTAAAENLKRLQVIAAVSEKKLSKLEQHTSGYSPTIKLPDRKCMQSPAVFDLLRIGDTKLQERRAAAAAAALETSDTTTSTTTTAAAAAATSTTTTTSVITSSSSSGSRIVVPSAAMGVMGVQGRLPVQIIVSNTGAPAASTAPATTTTPSVTTSSSKSKQYQFTHLYNLTLPASFLDDTLQAKAKVDASAVATASLASGAGASPPDTHTASGGGKSKGKGKGKK